MANDRKWRGLYVDRGLKVRWLERLNSIRRITICGTCSGHRRRDAFVMYEVRSNEDILLAIAHLGHIARVSPLWDSSRKAHVAYVQKPPAGGGFKYLTKPRWWGQVIGWLEEWYGKKLAQKR